MCILAGFVAFCCDKVLAHPPVDAAKTLLNEWPGVKAAAVASQNHCGVHVVTALG